MYCTRIRTNIADKTEENFSKRKERKKKHSAFAMNKARGFFFPTLFLKKKKQKKKKLVAVFFCNRFVFVVLFPVVSDFLFYFVFFFLEGRGAGGRFNTAVLVCIEADNNIFRFILVYLSFVARTTGDSTSYT